jgi:hypothetical protein
VWHQHAGRSYRRLQRLGRCCRYVLGCSRGRRCLFWRFRHFVSDILADAVAKEAANDRTTGSTSYARPGPVRAPIADREVDDDEDGAHRYEGEGIVADDDDDDY